MNNKVVLMSFADSKFKPSLLQLKQQVEEFKTITETHFFTERDLDAEFKKDFHPFIYRRGYGYWKWKAYLCKKVLDELAMDDILIWSDAGNAYNAKAEARFIEYLELIKKSQSGILVFQDPNPEKQYTKADCFAFFNVLNNKNITETNQIWAGGWIIRKTNNSISLIDRWYKTIMEHFDLATDKKSVTPNFPEFMEHRHDQSIFSILVKQYDVEYIPYAEIALPISPIQPTRFRQQSKLMQGKQYLLFPLRCIIHLYLIYIKGFYFKNRIIW